jgi:hypothetical protein
VGHHTQFAFKILREGHTAGFPGISRARHTDFSLNYCFQKPRGIEPCKTMPRAKERKQKPKGAAPSVVPALQKFLKTYQKHCVQSRTSVCPAIHRDLKSSIDREQILGKVSGRDLDLP